MLNIVLIHKTNDFFDALISEKILAGTIVTPNPKIADGVRKRLPSQGAIDAITISKFIKNELTALGDQEVLERYKGKSELILILGAIWKKIGRNNIVDFKRAFNLLTEFRSFSISDQVLETVLEHYDEELRSGVLWLHRFLAQLELIDEHQSYFYLSEKLRAGDLLPSYETQRNIVFYGFEFMTASQVDLIKSLALREDVVIPFYKEVYESSEAIDWIRWFDDHNTKIVDLGEPIQFLNKRKLFRFSKNYMGRVLEQEVGEEEKVLVLAEKNITRESIQELPFTDLKFKSEIDLFNEDFLSLISEVDSWLVTGPQAIAKIEEKLKHHLDYLIEFKKFREIKCGLLLSDKLQQWQGLAEENNQLDVFSFEIIKESVSLDLPRVNLATLSSSASNEVISIQDIEFIKEKNVVFAMNSNHGSLKGSGAQYTENVEKYLSSIGPLRRAELESELLKSKFKEFLTDNNVDLYVENHLLEHDVSISRLFSFLEIENTSVFLKDPIRKQYNLLVKEDFSLSRLSASRLQKYKECPQKYYLQYLAKLSPQIDFKDEINVLERGQIEHKILELYLKQNSEYDEQKHHDVIHHVLAKYLKQKKVTSQKDILVELKAYTTSAIQSLIRLKQNYGLYFHFEYDFDVQEEGIQYLGSVDLFAESDEHQFIIDFKRSNRIFTSFISILNYDQIQLWFYYQRLNKLNKIVPTKKIWLGYMDLSNLENSMFFTDDFEQAKSFKQDVFVAKVKALDEMQEFLSTYKEQEENLVQALRRDKEFPPRPLDKEACQFCTLKNICPREAL